MDQGKRKQTEKVDDEANTKKLKINEKTISTYLTQLPECVLNVLLAYFDSSSLYALSQTCVLFNELIKQPVLWRYVDARNPPHDEGKFVYCCKRLSERTTHFLCRGERQMVQFLKTPMFNMSPSWSNLKVLALENQYIPGSMFPLRYFPPALEEISLKRTYVENGYHFFRFSSCLQKLRVVIVDHCQWFEANMLVSLANMKSLEILSMYMCKRLSDRDIGYLSLSGDYGLKRVKVIDARHTAIGNQLLSSMYKSTSLQELYFQCYSSTYQLDKMKRKLDIHRGAQREPNSYMSDDDDANLDTKRNSMTRRFGNIPLRMGRTDSVDDEGMSRFTYVKVTSSTPQKRPNSFLYKYPYSEECQCGFYENFWKNIADPQDETPKKHDYSSSDSDDDETKQLKRTIKKRRKQLKTMLKNRTVPSLYYVLYNTRARNCNRRMTHFKWIEERPPQTDEEVKMLEHTFVEALPEEGIIVFGLNQQRFTCAGHNILDICNRIPSSSDEDSSDDLAELSSSEEQPGAAPSRQYFPTVYLRIGRSPTTSLHCVLTTLSLRGYPKVTDLTLQYLENVPLKLLDVSYTNVTAKAVKDYMTTHPNCRVIHESACTCVPKIHF